MNRLTLPLMKPYRNADSGVTGYEYNDRRIHIRFASGAIHAYTRASIGAKHLAALKKLADSGDGLNTYINKHHRVKNGSTRIG